MSPLETGRQNPASVASFPHTETRPYVRNAATWRNFAGSPLQCALETDWLAGWLGRQDSN
jgi:hypothetical protein